MPRAGSRPIRTSRATQRSRRYEGQPWDVSVKSLVAFPQVLEPMNDKLDWTQKLGDAFLAQEKDVLAAVQRLRARAQESGNLKSNEQQNVIIGTGAGWPSQPHRPSCASSRRIREVIYVPAYNPTVVYGAWSYPALSAVLLAAVPGVLSGRRARHRICVGRRPCGRGRDLRQLQLGRRRRQHQRQQGRQHRSQLRSHQGRRAASGSMTRAIARVSPIATTRPARSIRRTSPAPTRAATSVAGTAARRTAPRPTGPARATAQAVRTTRVYPIGQVQRTVPTPATARAARTMPVYPIGQVADVPTRQPRGRCEQRGCIRPGRCGKSCRRGQPRRRRQYCRCRQSRVGVRPVRCWRQPRWLRSRWPRQCLPGRGRRRRLAAGLQPGSIQRAGFELQQIGRRRRAAAAVAVADAGARET